MKYVRKHKEVKRSSEVKSFLKFTLGNEQYAIDTLLVQEVHHYENITPLQNTPAFIKGFMRLRGGVVLIVDLRIFYHLTQVEYNSSTIVIILNINGKKVGLVVDKMPDILSLEKDQMKPISDLCIKIPAIYVKGVSMAEEDVLILLDIERLLMDNELDVAGNIIENPT